MRYRSFMRVPGYPPKYGAEAPVHRSCNRIIFGHPLIALASKWQGQCSLQQPAGSSLNTLNDPSQSNVCAISRARREGSLAYTGGRRHTIFEHTAFPMRPQEPAFEPKKSPRTAAKTSRGAQVEKVKPMRPAIAAESTAELRPLPCRQYCYRRRFSQYSLRLAKYRSRFQ